MSTPRRLLLVVSGVTILLASPWAWATMDNVKSFKQAYPKAKSASCKTCHQHVIGKGGDLNTYGAALKRSKAAAGAKKLTVEDYRAAEPLDADGDGATNGDELQAGTDPANATSAPHQ